MASSLHAIESNFVQCLLRKQAHSIYKCFQFLKMSPLSRYRTAKEKGPIQELNQTITEIGNHRTTTKGIAKNIRIFSRFDSSVVFTLEAFVVDNSTIRL